MIRVPVRLRKAQGYLVRRPTQLVGQDIHHSVMTRNENNVLSRMDLRFSRRRMVTLPFSLRLNGHPSGPFNQDVSDSCSICIIPTYSVARSEPSSIRIRTVK
jgi:hypothetical protein